MQAVVKVKPGKGNIELREEKEPVPRPGEVKIKVEAAGICGSDIHIWDDDIKIPLKPPVIIGHEFSGVIDETGACVEGLKKGDRVTAETAASTCGQCRYCRTGRYNLCDQRLGTGYWKNGAFAAYVTVPAERVHIVPENVDLKAAALCEPLACCVHGVVELTGITAGELVVITGPGPIGLLSLQLAKAEGGLVVVCGLTEDEHRLAKASELGADYVVNLQKEDMPALVNSLSDGYGADVFLECAGAPPAADLGLNLLRKSGRYTQVGLFGRPINLDFEKIAYKELIVTGTFSQKWTAWKIALRLLNQGKVRTSPLISDILPLAEWETGFKKHRAKEGLKIILKP